MAKKTKKQITAADLQVHIDAIHDVHAELLETAEHCRDRTVVVPKQGEEREAVHAQLVGYVRDCMLIAREAADAAIVARTLVESIERDDELARLQAARNERAKL